eukprot:TRINITY_DN1348_c0_g2_i1.p1 TRINITY_DN1348_c0_g2~~TRINITY_DN1348_c0_g2_i1.p1  ORF type:complete len:355 (+),score=80.44 TRINITY_DN1348_c0_g2_i1:125-1189(+)
MASSGVIASPSTANIIGSTGAHLSGRQSRSAGNRSRKQQQQQLLSSSSTNISSSSSSSSSAILSNQPSSSSSFISPSSTPSNSSSKFMKYVPVSSAPIISAPSTISSSTTTSNNASIQDEFIGRPLVPFFLPGSEQIENIDRKIVVPADDYKRVSGKVPVPSEHSNNGVIRVRTFQDGYFSDPKDVVVRGSSSSGGGGVSSDHGSAKKKKNKKGNSDASVVSDASTSSVKYANPSFFQSPDPSEIPLPKFLERFDILGESLVPSAARSVSPVLSKAEKMRNSSPVGIKFNPSSGVSSSPVKASLVGEFVQKSEPNVLPTYELISPAKLINKPSVSNIPSSPAVSVIPKPVSRLA